MATIKRSKNKTDELLEKMCGKEAVVEKFIADYKSRIGSNPENKENSRNKEEVVADERNFIEGISNKANYDSKVKEGVAENVNRSVKNLKNKESNNAKDENVNVGSKQKSNFIKNLPLPEGTIIKYEKMENGISISQSYKLQGKPKQGGFGITYIATYAGQNGGSKVAIKELYPYNTYRDKDNHQLDLDYNEKETNLYLSNFVKEANRIEKLKNEPNIDVGTLNLVITETPVFMFNENYYYVMEYVRGYSLSDIMYSFNDDEEAKNFLPPYSRLVIMDQLCNALENLHKIDCIHQDISPNNILIDFDKNGNIFLKVIDYGLATNLYKSSADSVSNVKDAGTYGFTDVFTRLSDYKDFLENGEGEKLKLIDIYSLGAILGYLCLLNVKYIKVDDFGLKYESIIKKNVLVKQVDVNWDEDNDSVIASKLQVNLIKKLVFDATNENLGNRIQTVEEFRDRLHVIMSIDEEYIRRMRLMAEIDQWKTNISGVSVELSNFKGEVELEVIKSKKDTAREYFKKGAIYLKNADERKDAIFNMDITPDCDLDELAKKIKDVNELYKQAAECLEQAKVEAEIPEGPGGPDDKRIETIKQWKQNAVVKSDRIKVFGDTVKDKVADHQKAMDVWYKGSEFMKQAEQYRTEIANVPLDKASSEELDATLQKTGLADTRYSMAETMWKEAKRIRNRDWIDKILKPLLVVLTVVGIGTGSYFGLDHFKNSEEKKPEPDTVFVKPDTFDIEPPIPVDEDTFDIEPPVPVKYPIPTPMTNEYLNEVFIAAQQEKDSVAKQRIKEIIDDNVKIYYKIGITNFNTDYDIKKFIGFGNTEYVIGKTYKINHFEKGTNGKIIEIELVSLN